MITGLVTLCACLVVLFSHAVQFNNLLENANGFCTVSGLLA